MIQILNLKPIFTWKPFEYMEIAQNEENNETSPVNNPPPFTHYSRVVYSVHTIYICEHISAGTGFRKEVYLQSLKRI